MRIVKDTDVTKASCGIYSTHHGIGGLELNSFHSLEGLVSQTLWGRPGNLQFTNYLGSSFSP